MKKRVYIIYTYSFYITMLKFLNFFDLKPENSLFNFYSRSIGGRKYEVILSINNIYFDLLKITIRSKNTLLLFLL